MHKYSQNDELNTLESSQRLCTCFLSSPTILPSHSPHCSVSLLRYRLLKWGVEVHNVVFSKVFVVWFWASIVVFLFFYFYFFISLFVYLFFFPPIHTSYHITLKKYECIYTLKKTKVILFRYYEMILFSFLGWGYLISYSLINILALLTSTLYRRSFKTLFCENDGGALLKSAAVSNHKFYYAIYLIFLLYPYITLHPFLVYSSVTLHLNWHHLRYRDPYKHQVLRPSHLSPLIS